MEKYILNNSIKVVGMQVKTFPEGIGEAFGSLSRMLPNGMNRAYYGISYINNEGKIIYIAASQEMHEGEAGKYKLESWTIEKGAYLTITVTNWRTKTDCIKDVFEEMMGDHRFDNTRPCVEWYKSDDEMMCMLKMKEAE